MISNSKTKAELIKDGWLFITLNGGAICASKGKLSINAPNIAKLRKKISELPEPTKKQESGKRIDKTFEKEFTAVTVSRNDLRALTNNEGERKLSDDFILSISEDKMQKIATHIWEKLREERFNALSSIDGILFEGWTEMFIHNVDIFFRFNDGREFLNTEEQEAIWDLLQDSESYGPLEGGEWIAR